MISKKVILYLILKKTFEYKNNFERKHFKITNFNYFCEKLNK